jgi:hypothetical protein
MVHFAGLLGTPCCMHGRHEVGAACTQCRPAASSKDKDMWLWLVWAVQCDIPGMKQVRGTADGCHSTRPDAMSGMAVTAHAQM